MARGATSLIAVILLAALAVTMAGVFPFRQILSQQDTVSATQAKLDGLVAENARLESEIARLETPEEVERLARDRFGMVREGEVGYVITFVPSDEEPAAPPALPPADDRTWYERMWDFATGEDSSSGG